MPENKTTSSPKTTSFRISLTEVETIALLDILIGSINVFKGKAYTTVRDKLTPRLWFAEWDAIKAKNPNALLPAAKFS